MYASQYAWSLLDRFTTLSHPCRILSVVGLGPRKVGNPLALTGNHGADVKVAVRSGIFVLSPEPTKYFLKQLWKFAFDN